MNKKARRKEGRGRGQMGEDALKMDCRWDSMNEIQLYTKGCEGENKKSRLNILALHHHKSSFSPFGLRATLRSLVNCARVRAEKGKRRGFAHSIVSCKFLLVEGRLMTRATFFCLLLPHSRLWRNINYRNGLFVFHTKKGMTPVTLFPTAIIWVLCCFLFSSLSSLVLLYNLSIPY